MLGKIILLILFLFILGMIIDNFRINIRKAEFKLESNDSKKETKKYKILHVSDFHNRRFGNDTYLYNKIKKINPDIVFITGDMFDRRNTNTDIVSEFFEELNKILDLNPNDELTENRVFYVYGNHEKYKEDGFLRNYEEMIASKNIKLLKNELIQLRLNNEIINIIGLDDITIPKDKVLEQNSEIKLSITDFFTKKNDINKFNMDLVEKNVDNFFNINKEKINKGHNIVLVHRPEAFDIYQKYNMDLVFTGHAHGGLARIPFTDISLTAPNQGIFPRYTKGPYTKNNTTMYVSMGLGNSILPIRIFSVPELIEIELEV